MAFLFCLPSLLQGAVKTLAHHRILIIRVAARMRVLKISSYFLMVCQPRVSQPVIQSGAVKIVFVVRIRYVAVAVGSALREYAPASETAAVLTPTNPSGNYWTGEQIASIETF